LIRAKLLTSSGGSGEGSPGYIGEELFDSGPGEFEFVVPAGVRRIHACAVGSGGILGGSNQLGGTGGGALAWANNIVVEPGEKITVKAGQPSTGGFNAKYGASGLYRIERDEDGDPILDDDDKPTYIKIMEAGGANDLRGGEFSFADSDIGTHGGGEGGDGSDQSYGTNTSAGSGGGAGGYMGNGGKANGGAPETGSGGGSAGTRWYTSSGNFPGLKNGAPGGGVGIRGRGKDGVAPPNTEQSAKPGKPGSGGEGEMFGGGGCNAKAGGHGAVRIIWGIKFSYPDNADIEAVE
jgi:hypothetical protein